MTLILHPGPLYTFAELEDLPLRHGIFPKQTNASGEECPATNAQIAEILGAEVYCDLHQRHTTTVYRATKTFPRQQPGDGLFTNELGLSLHIRHSDCQAAIFYDRKHHVVANVHSGWRGLVGNIYAVTVKNLKKAFNSVPKDLLVAIGPSLGPNYSIYPDYDLLFPRSFQAFMGPKEHIDFRALAHKQLRDLGIPEQNITIADICTYTEHTTFFSSRYVRQNSSQTHQIRRKYNNVTAVLLLPRE